MKIKELFKGEQTAETVVLEHLLERFRNWRKEELTATDWTQLPDAPIDAVAYASYRQALRDLPTAKNFANSEIPTRP